jgi:hypothetical protein
MAALFKVLWQGKTLNNRLGDDRQQTQIDKGNKRDHYQLLYHLLQGHWQSCGKSINSALVEGSLLKTGVEQREVIECMALSRSTTDARWFG